MKKDILIQLLKNSTHLLLKRSDINKIIQKITGLNKSQLFLCTQIDNKFEEEFKNISKQLKTGEPIEYILNNAEFYSLEFFVDHRVLIPRDDTQVMVEQALNVITDSVTLIDIGTGTSCIPISILTNTKAPPLTYAVDISKKALEVSEININKHKLEKNIKQLHSSLLNSFIENQELNITKDVIITANLPYIKQDDFDNMDTQVIDHEPDLALYGGKDTGFELYETLIDQCYQLKGIYSLEKLYLLIEIGFDQKEYAVNYLNNKALDFELFKDNSQVDRCIKIKF